MFFLTKANGCDRLSHEGQSIFQFKVFLLPEEHSQLADLGSEKPQDSSPALSASLEGVSTSYLPYTICHGVDMTSTAIKVTDLTHFLGLK